ncbi:MAG: hypothetical protein ACE5KM_19150 [Planctomycetaceae bacterium]
MPNIEYWIGRCCRQLNRGAMLKVAAEWLAVWFCAFGTLMLAAKFAWPVLWPHAAWLGLTAIPVLGLAVRRGCRDRYSPTEGAALLDGNLNSGGLLMAVAEKRDAQWRRSLPADDVVWTRALPKLRPVRFARLLALPVVFAVVALLLPPRPTPSNAAARLKPLPAVDELPDMLEQLKQADVLDPAEYEFLNEEISKLVKSTKKSPPTPEHWRKIDALRTRMNNRLEGQVRILEKGRQAADKLAAAGKPDAPPLTAAQRRRLEKDFAEAVKRLPSGKVKPVGKQPANRKLPAVAKTGEQKSPQPKKTGGKVPPKKTTVNGKRPKVPGKTIPGAVGKTGPKRPGGKPRKSPAGKANKQPTRLPRLDKLADLKTAMKIFQKLPPAVQQQLMRRAMRMLERGGFQLPRDPETRRKLMQEAQKLLTTHRDDLEKLRRRFEQTTGNTNLDRRLPLSQHGNRSNGNGGANPGGKSAPGAKPDPDGKTPKRNTVSFRDVVLPPGLLDKARPQTDDVTGKTPAVKPFQPTVKPKRTGGDTTTSNPQWRALRRKVRPRHRDLIYRYFFEKADKKP